MPAVFINYRRADAEGDAGRLHAELLDRFLGAELFMDVDNLDAGENFVLKLEEALASSDLMLVVIGKLWLTLVDDAGRRRLEDPEDFVRLEISRALERQMKIIPVLVQGARMPVPSALPDLLRPLAHLQAVELRHSRYADDVEYLIESALAMLRIEAPATPAAPHYRVTIARKLRRLTELALCAAFIVLGVVCTYRFGYPGWTVRGFATDLKAIGTSFAFFAPGVFYLWRTLRGRRGSRDVDVLVRHLWRMESNWLILVGLLLANIALGIVVVARTPPSALTPLVRAVDQSDWPGARGVLGQLAVQPLERRLLVSAESFVQIHEEGENYQNRESRAYRQLLTRTVSLLQEGIDPDAVNSLSQAEAAKLVFFIEDSTEELDSAIGRLGRMRSAVSPPLASRLIAKAGELRLAQRRYDDAERHFVAALVACTY